MAQILTSSWFTTLPADHSRIGISRGVPLKATGHQLYKRLAPGPWYRTCSSPQQYAERYFQILARLDPSRVVSELEALSEGSIPTLLCWEHPPPSPPWCHRALVSAWLFDELGLEVPEFGHEALGYGWQHPKLHPSLMRVAA